MSYQIYYSFQNQKAWEDITNYTLKFLSEPDNLIHTEYFQAFYEDYSYGDPMMWEKEGFEDEEDFKLWLAKNKFLASEYFNEMESCYYPQFNYLHVLQNNSIPDKAIELCCKLTPDVVLVHSDELDTNFIALRSIGTDLSDQIELAYYIVDGVAPERAHDIFTLSEEAKKLLLDFREGKHPEMAEDDIEDIKENIISEVNKEGYLVLSAIVCGHFFRRRYLYYSEEEALELFLEEIKKEKEKCSFKLRRVLV